MSGVSLKNTIDLSPLKGLQQRSPKIFMSAQRKAGIQFLNWANNGSANTSKKPPIRWGVLRGSSSVFRGKFLVKTFDISVKEGSPEAKDPAKEFEGEAAPTTLTFVWNTNYATKMHEGEYKLGKFSVQDGNAGPKWLEDHLDKDRDDLMKVIAKEFKQEAGM